MEAGLWWSEAVSSCHLRKAKHLVNISAVASLLQLKNVILYTVLLKESHDRGVIYLQVVPRYFSLTLLLHFNIWIHMKEALFLKHYMFRRILSILVSPKLRVSSVWPWPYFSTWTVFSHPNLAERGSWNIREKGKGSIWEKEAYLHVSTSIQTERQAGREAWGQGKHSSSF